MKDRAQTVRPSGVRLVAAVALASALLVSARPSPAAHQAAPAPAAQAFIAPDVLSQVAAGPTMAILAYDRATTSSAQLVSYLADHGVQAHAFEKVPVAYACAASADVLRTIASAPGALSIYGDAPLHPALDQSVPTAFAGDPHAVWDTMGLTGKGVGIAVLDTGIDATHPDLQFGVRTKRNVRVVVSHRDILGQYQDPCVQDTFTPESQDTEISSGHGTHITSVAAGDGTISAGRYRGVAPEADIMGVAVYETVTPRQNIEETQTQLSMLGGIAGLNYVLLNGLEGGVIPVKVVLAGWVQDGLYDPWHPMSLTLQDMAALGINVVFPAGNAGPTPSDCSTAANCHINMWSASYPTITVAATPKRSRTELESYSSRGDPQDRTFHDETFRYQPTLAAPGTNVVAARRVGLAGAPAQTPGSLSGAGGNASVFLDRSYVPLTGTSVSAAHVAGAIALMQQGTFRNHGCFLTPWQVTNILQSTATPIEGSSATDVGAGMVDVTRAVQMASVWPPDRWLC